MLQEVFVAGSQIRPVFRPWFRGFFRVRLVGGSNRSFDVHSPAEMRYDRVVIGDLGLGSVSDNLPCLLQLCVWLHSRYSRLTVCLGQSQRWKDKVREPHCSVSWWRWLFQPSLRIDKAGQNVHCASQPHTGLAPGAEDCLSCLTAKAHHRAKRNEDRGSRQCQTSRGYYWGYSGASCVMMRQSNCPKRLGCVQLAGDVVRQGWPRP